MRKEDKRVAIKFQREKLIEELEKVYKNAFDEISNMELEEGSVAKLSKAFLLSRQAAISELEKEIEKPIITKAANEK
ncbi:MULTISPECIES: hercynine metabolism small protein [Prochlorococcus]|uniref:Uncharacterized protein n=1 Tax=Prochlorococcus marinus (strain SARG / CCMP1375 / SS120) TaxID=167539 RepID=Q7V9Q2_PROMA|nr:MULTISPECIES: hercynine metabolism small protein [Prochlorococcus]AAQ00821.1 Predicted protein [Prochlorococcus marinus subsp. marinus str. CCMP1375]KGG10684.1 hypothetical protein EV04_1644 [Prochlorococcus marinus str. LG]KGG21105.1 hypothetical protein EV08_0821 [Prochlorococcus marinus str. SS2]KGG23930.1 hypothetical protein EV09_0534 [Prochlorococcus marinus str. SS35]KGG31810.1 hypothetical protein EV10_1908 [Prochlorococcus marinus str. SS51]